MSHINRLFVQIVVLTFNFVNGDQATNGSGLAITEIGNVSGFLDQNESCGCNVNSKMMTTKSLIDVKSNKQQHLHRICRYVLLF